jgi:hypothetical protein
MTKVPPARPAAATPAEPDRVPLPGRFISIIRAAARASSPPLPLDAIALDAPDEAEMARMLWYHFGTRFNGLSVEQRVQWAAVYMFACARESPDGEETRALPAVGLDLLPLLRRARDLWVRHGVDVPDAAFAASVDRVARDRASELPDDDGDDDPSFTLTVEKMLPVLGRNRLRMRIEADDGAEPRSARPVRFRLRVPGRSDVRVVIEDAPGASKFDAESVWVPIGENGVEVVFRLYAGEPESEVPVEVFRHGGRSLGTGEFRAWKETA